MSPKPQSGGFSLFPSTSASGPSSGEDRSRSRSPAPLNTVPEPNPAEDRSPARPGRQSSIRRAPSTREGKQAASAGRRPATDGRASSLDRRDDTIGIAIERPAPAVIADIPPRCETAFSEAQTLVRSSSNRSRSSIAKPPINYAEGSGTQPASSGEPAPLRSIFPTFNPTLPLDRQDYYPSHASPTHIPRSAISRPLYSPSNVEPRTPGPALRSPMMASPPMSGASAGRWLPSASEPPVVPPTSTTEELRGFWKVTNGWKAAASEGRVYCMRLTAENDAPIYTLSSQSQPFYNLRISPNSASAYVTMSRYDPHKTYKAAASANGRASPSSGGGNSPGGSKGDAKNWQEVMSTTLEEESRKLPPHDGLVALLYPSAAAKMALERPSDPAVVDRAESECARLVWDADSGNHFLVHPALAMPFCVTVERNPAWSRTEYTLEHLESPRHLARLTRDGTGEGWLELDTSIAAKIDAAYLADVAVAALLLVAHKDDRYTKVEVFAPPPVASPVGSFAEGSGGDGRGSRASRRDSRREEKKRQQQQQKKKPRSRMEEFELDIESQSSELASKLESKRKGKAAKNDDEEKLPFVVRALVKLLTGTFKFALWIVKILFKTLEALVGGLAKCLHAEKR